MGIDRHKEVPEQLKLAVAPPHFLPPLLVLLRGQGQVLRVVRLQHVRQAGGGGGGGGVVHVH